MKSYTFILFIAFVCIALQLVEATPFQRNDQVIRKMKKRGLLGNGEARTQSQRMTAENNRGQAVRGGGESNGLVDGLLGGKSISL